MRNIDLSRVSNNLVDTIYKETGEVPLKECKWTFLFLPPGVSESHLILTPETSAEPT